MPEAILEGIPFQTDGILHQEPHLKRTPFTP
jgi:hypothetical protein